MAIINNGKTMKKVQIIPTKKEALFDVNINSAKLSIPDWYKQSSQKIKGFEKYSLIPENPGTTTGTYKKCSPFLDALTNGYIFYLSQDLEVTKNNEGLPLFLWRSPFSNPIGWHSNDQWEGLIYPENCHSFLYKWENNFIIKTPKKYSTLFTHPHNRFDLPFYTLSGIVDTDKYNLAVHFPFFIKKDFTGIIKAGTPITQITFFKRDFWFKHVKKYDEHYVQKENFNFFKNIERSYKNIIWQKKEYN